MSIIVNDNTFDIFAKRLNTDSIKFDFNEKFNKPNGLIPLWIADMDFMSPVEVRNALAAKVEHGIYGYSDTREDYHEIVKAWFKNGFGYSVESDWIVETPGIVFALATAIRAFTDFGDAILIQPPVYPPFAETISLNERRVVLNPLKYENYTYSLDLHDFEHKIVSEDVKMFILCSPHNPIGRVWTFDELKHMTEICKKHKVLIISDEIHADFVYEGHKHLMLPTVAPDMAHQIVTCTSPSKTFNLAGLQISNLFISNPKLKQKFSAELLRTGYHSPTLMGIEACKAAYQYGKPWLNDLLLYLKGNIDYFKTTIEQEIPEIKVIVSEGTYLVWIDFNALNLTQHDLDKLMQDSAKLWLNSGTTFGYGGEGFQRINMATHRTIIEQATKQLVDAIKNKKLQEAL